MAYASKAKFAGQRASAGRMVIIGVPSDDGGVWVRAGVVLGVSSKTDQVYIRDLAHDKTEFEVDWAFRDCKTEDDTLLLRVGEWSWPPRV